MTPYQRGLAAGLAQHALLTTCDIVSLSPAETQRAIIVAAVREAIRACAELVEFDLTKHGDTHCDIIAQLAIAIRETP